MSGSNDQMRDTTDMDGPPMGSKDWQARMRHDRPSGVIRPERRGAEQSSPPANKSARARRKISRLELGTFANDLEAAAAFLGRNRKSIEGYLAEGIAEKYAKVLDAWTDRRAFPIDLPYEPGVIGWPAHDAIHQLRAGNPHIAGPIAVYALDGQARSYRTGVRNQSNELQTFFLRAVVALSWVIAPNPERVEALSGAMEGIPRLAALHHEVVAVIAAGRHERDSAVSEPWFYLHELTAGFMLCCELLKIVCNMFVPPGESRVALTREEQRVAARAVLTRYGHYQLAEVTRVHSSSRMHWNFVQLATIANERGLASPRDERPEVRAIVEARAVFMRGIAQLRRNYGPHFPAVQRFLERDEDTGPLLRELLSGGLDR